MGAARPRLLCVDDDPDVLLGLRLVLRRRYDVATALSGADALQAMAEACSDGEGFAAVLADLRMPGMSGAELLATARRRYPDLPRLLLTGQSDAAAARTAGQAAGVFRLLSKPCPTDVLLRALAEAVSAAGRPA